jgi:hypothetical protein
MTTEATEERIRQIVREELAALEAARIDADEETAVYREEVSARRRRLQERERLDAIDRERQLRDRITDLEIRQR